MSVPSTVQAAIEARIDRLSTPAKRTLHAASVIGARFGAELLAALGIDAVVDEPLVAELIDQVPLMRTVVDHLFREGHLLLWGILATGVLVETLLDRGTDGDVAEAETAIERLTVAPSDDGLVIRDVWLLRLRALLSRAGGDTAAYADFRDRDRDMRERLASRDIPTGPRRCRDVTRTAP
jgi:hypothetical protein